MLRGEGHNESLDCWCLGVLTYELLTGLNPFAPRTQSYDFEDILRRNIAKANPRFPRDFPALGKDFVRKIITKKMTRRLTIKQMLEHSWMKDTVKKIESKRASQKLRKSKMPNQEPIA